MDERDWISPYELDAMKADYASETRVFKTMKTLFYVLGSIVAIGTLALFLLKLDTFPREAGLGGLLLAVPIIIFAVALAGLFVGCVPAGFIGLWRAVSRSRVLVFGGSNVILFILALAATLPAILGPVFYLLQWNKVRKMRAQLEGLGVL